MVLKENFIPESINENFMGDDKPYVDLKKYWSTLIIFGLLSALRSMTNILSCGLTSAYNIAIVNLLSPLITPIADKVWLGAEIPNITWVAIMFTSLGCCAMVYGEYLIYGNDARVEPGAGLTR
jgi:drug/metabolite transporter (DMT)-like permease